MRRARRRTTLLCNDCDNKFEDLAMFVKIRTADGKELNWMAAEDAARGIRCPRCRSERISVVKPQLPPGTP